MSSSSTKPIIFISYAHADESEKPVAGEIKWNGLVRKFLRAGERRGFFEIWVDVEMMGGDDWEERIKERVRSCRIFVFAVHDQARRVRECLADQPILLAILAGPFDRPAPSSSWMRSSRAKRREISCVA